MSDLLDAAARRASRYLESLDTRSVAPAKEAVAALAKFERGLPEQTSSAEAVLAELDEIGSPATMASAGGRFFGFVIGGSLPVTVAANWLAAAWDQNAGLVVTSPANAAARDRRAALAKGYFPSARAQRWWVCHLCDGGELCSARRCATHIASPRWLGC